jgi:uncharacterized protein
MIVILSPSKTLDFSDTQTSLAHSNSYGTPDLLKETLVLIKHLKKKTAGEIAQLMSISDKLASLNYERYQSFSTPFVPQNARQALLAFKGDVYTDIAVDTYTQGDFEFAQMHVRILSGLYGLLRPLDLIQPYRLEMGTRLSTSKGNSLYEFWGDKITKQLNQHFQEHPRKTLVNLASNEYFKAVNPKKLKAGIITPIFKQYKNGNYKVIALFAKRARGTMTNFIIQKKIDEVERLKTFNEAAYEYNERLSSETEWVFVR